MQADRHPVRLFAWLRPMDAGRCGPLLLEMRIYSLRPGRAGAVLDRIGRALPGRLRLSPLAAMWYADTGRLDRIYHLWPFADLAERTSVRARFAELDDWPVRNDDDIMESESRIMRPAPFCPHLCAAKLGPLYEICVDAMRPHGLHDVVESWASAIERRSALSPFVGAWSSEIGPLNLWTHIWAYESYEHRLVVKSQCRRDAIWPPQDDELFRERSSTLVWPAEYSPLN